MYRMSHNCKTFAPHPSVVEDGHIGLLVPCCMSNVL